MKKKTHEFPVLPMFFIFLELLALTITETIFSYSKPIEELPEPEPIPFEQMIAHTEEVKYHEWYQVQLPEIEEPKAYLIDVTDEDIDLMARVVMSEASTLSSDAKQAIATVIVNRVRDEKSYFRNLNTVKDVVYHGNAFSTQDNGEPDETCYEAVYAALEEENAFDPTMFWFWEHQYPTYPESVPYMNIGTTYFSVLGGDK